MTTPRDWPASAANRDGGRGVEVRDARGRLVCRTTAERAEAAVTAGAGRLVGGGRVLRIDRGAALRLMVGEDSVTTRRVSRTTGAHEHDARRSAAYGGAR